MLLFQITLFYNGILYGAMCSVPYLVPVPMAEYCPHPPHIDFLATERWLNGGSLNRDCVNLEESRFTLHTWPGSSFALRFCYTFYVTSQAITHYSVQNNLVQSFSNGKLRWRGDVLVVKCTPDSPDSPVNMDQTDIELVNSLLLRRVKCQPIYLYN
jgi:hypothetical protein